MKVSSLATYGITVSLSIVAGMAIERTLNIRAAYDCINREGFCVGVIRDSERTSLGEIKFYPSDKVTINEAEK